MDKFSVAKCNATPVVYHSKDKSWHEKEISSNLGYLPHPSTAIFVGRPNSGKTSIILNCLAQHWLVPGIKAFEKVILIHKLSDIGSPEYADVGEILETLHDVPTSIQELFDVEDLDIESIPKTAIIIEDINIKALKRSQKDFINRLFGCYSTHCNISVYLAAQEPISIPVDIRRQTKYVAIWRYPCSETMNLLSSRFDIKGKDLKALFESICPNPHDCIMLAYESPIRMRKNLFTAITEKPT